MTGGRGGAVKEEKEEAVAGWTGARGWESGVERVMAMISEERTATESADCAYQQRADVSEEDDEETRVAPSAVQWMHIGVDSDDD